MRVRYLGTKDPINKYYNNFLKNITRRQFPEGVPVDISSSTY